MSVSCCPGHGSLGRAGSRPVGGLRLRSVVRSVPRCSFVSQDFNRIDLRCATRVEKEVETALEREYREHRVVLFPIRLDDSVMDANEAWAADIRRTRHIGDFRKWEQHGEYVKAFNRLHRDLKAEPGDKAIDRSEP
jgi:hypothetical protein